MRTQGRSRSGDEAVSVMKIITGRLVGPPPQGEAAPPTSIAIGNFDGVHRGHLAVIQRAQKAADENGYASGVLTFDPHPRQFFAPDGPPFLLMSLGSKMRRLAALDIDVAFVAAFDTAFAALSDATFAANVLSERLNARHVVVGEDFCFGAGRKGDVAKLREYGQTLGFDVDVVAPIGDAQPFSSSAARQALRDGQPQVAKTILGDWYRVEGHVERGDQRGRELGFPTANLPLDGLWAPAFGVYAVKVEILDGDHQGHYHGAASVGVRPQFDKKIPNFETHIFDFDADIYGAAVSIALVTYLRPERRFSSIEALIEQMRADCDDARSILATVESQTTA